MMPHAADLDFPEHLMNFEHILAESRARAFGAAMGAESPSSDERSQSRSPTLGGWGDGDPPGSYMTDEGLHRDMHEFLEGFDSSRDDPWKLDCSDDEMGLRLFSNYLDEIEAGRGDSPTRNVMSPSFGVPDLHSGSTSSCSSSPRSVDVNFINYPISTPPHFQEGLWVPATNESTSGDSDSSESECPRHVPLDYPPPLPEVDEDALRTAWPFPNGHRGDDAFRLCLCPITHDVMREPVLAMDGMTYERDAIRKWLDSCQRCTSPVTNQEMPGDLLIPNHAVRSLIRTLMDVQADQQKQPEVVKSEVATQTSSLSGTVGSALRGDAGLSVDVRRSGDLLAARSLTAAFSRAQPRRLPPLPGASLSRPGSSASMP
mmetsp:Transcript_34568/g.90185  ORF Transcript_34568/g.90185 Transcript_34568/m.90185 type:complete len:373 (+) Transcript_34568:65-1183(+)